jgi:hypothetical protein
MEVSILSGIVTDEAADFRRSYPRNMVPVPVEQGISTSYLRPADGIELFGTGPGVDRGGINWRGTMYRVMGTKLVSVDATGAVTVRGDVGGSGQATLDYSFDYLIVSSGGSLFYFDGTTVQQVTDPDLGVSIASMWVDGYTMSTDGTFLVVTELSDPFAVNPLKYGSSEFDPDPIKRPLKLRNEVYALNRYTIEVFNNIGGTNFPFQRIDGAVIQKGCIGTHACALYADTIAFVGSGRNEAPSIYMITPGNAVPIATREINQIIKNYSEAELSQAVVESRLDGSNEHLLIHLPDMTLVYDHAASLALGQVGLVWFTLSSSVTGNSTYRARNLVWCYDKWLAGDPTSSNIGALVNTVSTHYGETIGWEFGTQFLYAEGNGAIVHELELVSLPGRVVLGADPVVWTSYSIDGETWSQERATPAGKQGQRNKRIAWRKQGKMQHYRAQKFRGTSDAHLTVARLEVALEPLFTRPRNG